MQVTVNTDVAEGSKIDAVGEPKRPTMVDAGTQVSSAFSILVVDPHYHVFLLLAVIGVTMSSRVTHKPSQ